MKLTERITTILGNRPMCDVCGNRLASYDAKTVNGLWAFLCERCFAKLGVGLGLGKGQKLVESNFKNKKIKER